jgi:hypothetical protein
MAEVNLGNSRKNSIIRELESQLQAKDRCITALEYKLSENIINGEELEYKFERLRKKIEKRQHPSLRGMVTGLIRQFRKSRRLTPTPLHPEQPHCGGQIVQQVVASDSDKPQALPSTAPESPGDLQGKAPSEQSQAVASHSCMTQGLLLAAPHISSDRQAGEQLDQISRVLCFKNQDKQHQSIGLPSRLMDVAPHILELMVKSIHSSATTAFVVG